MATHDWNHDGRNDMIDNYIEYQIYKDVTGQNDEPSYTTSRGNGMSTFGAIISDSWASFTSCFVYGTWN